MTNFYTTVPSPIGDIVLTSNGEALTGVYPPENSHYAEAQKGAHDAKPFKEAIKQLNEYFAGERIEFDLPLAPEGTEFQKKVWNALCKIGYGQTTSYGQLAKSLGDANASRAVGTANGRNPFCIVVPCHRVIGASGDLAGYNGDLKAKQWLIDHERAHIKLAA